MVRDLRNVRQARSTLTKTASEYCLRVSLSSFKASTVLSRRTHLSREFDRRAGQTYQGRARVVENGATALTGLFC